MNLHHLEYIVEIANEKIFQRLRKKLHISQPTLSIYLSKLEKELNLKLFHRANNVDHHGSRGSMWTPAKDIGT